MPDPSRSGRCRGSGRRSRPGYDRCRWERETTRYRCLIIDHDDTAVDGTQRVHYPAHRRVMEILRPDSVPIDLDTWFRKNCHPGILSYLIDELGMTPEELEIEHEIWREFTSRERPEFYPGFLAALAAFQDRGGLVVVVSHSEEHVIKAHYAAAPGDRRVAPDLVFGWDLGPEQRKPHPYPVLETMRRFDLASREVLVVDDLKPGIDMARAAGVDAAAACWAHDIPEIRAFMERNCVATFDTVAEFAAFVLR
jgi:HAD superfamily hydrolase (TIGR01509 family)